MYGIFAKYIMLSTGVGEVINLNVVLDTLPYETIEWLESLKSF